jgi:type IV pilus assembly protein PilY1
MEMHGEFAKRLYSGVNPAGVKIQTAFVGYSNSFNNLSSGSDRFDVQNACKLGSNLKGDKCSYYQIDGLTKNTASYANHIGGFGNGGFYTANSADDVTTSVLNFIDNLGTDPLEPLPTGSLSVPVDSLNPNGLQNLGYLRMLEPNPAQPSLLTWAGNLKNTQCKMVCWLMVPIMFLTRLVTLIPILKTYGEPVLLMMVEK